MEEYTLIQIRLPKDFNHKLNLYMLRLKELNVKTSKAQVLACLAEIGLNHETKNPES